MFVFLSLSPALLLITTSGSSLLGHFSDGRVFGFLSTNISLYFSKLKIYGDFFLAHRFTGLSYSDLRLISGKNSVSIYVVFPSLFFDELLISAFGSGIAGV
jgi:hypothetical protein